jgi:hypothetical protein
MYPIFVSDADVDGLKIVNSNDRTNEDKLSTCDRVPFSQHHTLVND